jgi:hypothetical protein
LQNIDIDVLTDFYKKAATNQLSIWANHFIPYTQFNASKYC